MIVRILSCFLLIGWLGGCSEKVSERANESTSSSVHENETGPHGGQMLRKEAVSLEVVLVEAPQGAYYQLYGYKDNQPLAPSDIQAILEITRLEGAIERFTFRPQDDHLISLTSVEEPHSFDVKVQLTIHDRAYEWTVDSYEGRTVIPSAIAKEAGIQVERVGPALLKDQVQVMGNVALNPGRHTLVKARFPGTVRGVHVQEGQTIKRGQTLITIEGNESMRHYPIAAPFDGIVLSVTASVGDIADSNTLLEMADLSKVWVELHAMGSTLAQIRPGQTITVRSSTSSIETMTTIDTILPLATRSQSVIIRGTLANLNGFWRPGMTVTAEVTTLEKEVPMAVRASALQRWRDSTVVFVQQGDIYEARKVILGRQDGEFSEVLDGLAPGARYVSQQSFLIKADIEKSGAGHEH